MAKYRKKPVVVEALQWLGTSTLEGIERLDTGAVKSIRRDNHQLRIQTLEGEMRADPGDWIIKGIKGELYPCKPDIFDATYELVE